MQDKITYRGVPNPKRADGHQVDVKTFCWSLLVRACSCAAMIRASVLSFTTGGVFYLSVARPMQRLGHLWQLLLFLTTYRVLTSVASISSCSQLIIPAISWPIVFTVFIDGLDLISTVQVVSHSQFYILEVFGCGWPPCIMVLTHLWDTQAFVAILYICYSAF